MATETWEVDGQNLSRYAFDIRTFDGLDDVPDIVSEDVEQPQGHGITPGVPYFGPGRKAVSMNVSTADPTTGVRPSTVDAMRANFDKNLDTLLRIFYRRKLLTVRRTLSDGSVRVAKCRTVSGIKPKTIGIADAIVVFDLQLPYSFWEDENNVTATVGVGNNQALAQFATATAPLNELEFDIAGPATNPRITDPETGAWVQFNGALASGETMTLKNADMTVTGPTGVGLGNMTHSGDPKWLTLYPSPTGVLVSLSAGTLTVRGKRKYLR